MRRATSAPSTAAAAAAAAGTRGWVRWGAGRSHSTAATTTAVVRRFLRLAPGPASFSSRPLLPLSPLLSASSSSPSPSSPSSSSSVVPSSLPSGQLRKRECGRHRRAFHSTSPALADGDDGGEGGGGDDVDDEAALLEEEQQHQRQQARARGGGKYAAEDAELEFLARTLVWEYRGMHAPRPMLSEQTKEELYRLHKLDPRRWDLDNLSLYFGLRKDRVQAILTFMGMREEAVRQGEVLHGGVVELLEQEFGVVDRLADKRLLATERSGGRPGSGLPLEEDAIDNDNRLLDHARALRLARAPRGGAPREELPPSPPARADGSEAPEAQSRVLRQPTPTQPHDYKGYIFIEKDSRRPSWGRRQRYDDATRIIFVAEPNGTLRTPTWEERRRLTSINKQPPIPYRPDPAERRFFKDDN